MCLRIYICMYTPKTFILYIYCVCVCVFVYTTILIYTHIGYIHIYLLNYMRIDTALCVGVWLVGCLLVCTCIYGLVCFIASLSAGCVVQGCAASSRFCRHRRGKKASSEEAECGRTLTLSES